MSKLKTEEKASYHLWGVRSRRTIVSDGLREDCIYNRWEYIKPADNNRRCLNNVDKREWSQLEIRSDTGALADFIETLSENKNDS